MNDRADESANLLGAAGLLVAGKVRDAITGAVGAGGALGEALIAVKDQPGRTADWLAAVLHLSQPGTAHLVRRLTENGWVTRDSNGRARPLRLTPKGNRAAAAALKARQEVLTTMVDRLTAEQQEQLVAITSALLGPEARSEQALAQLCRLCDRSTCPHCPVHESWQTHEEP
jgi:DNA-binding MarR family transcriptional regulator